MPRLGEPRLDVESCESTQQLVDTSLPEGAIVVADHQTAGRGRLGRSWEAPAGTALLFSVQLKWPNDVMLRRRKIAGCLAEARDGAVVLGIGVNVNQTSDQLPENAGSIRSLTGRAADREELLSMLLADVESRYSAWLAGGLDAVYEGLGPRDFLRGREVTVNGVRGVVSMIDRQGRLEIGVGHGEHVTVESGEVVYAR
jgi:BirA family biotin operon repressor/biotin-[acetyl-CoA-carboxylase] ligase